MTKETKSKTKKSDINTKKITKANKYTKKSVKKQTKGKEVMQQFETKAAVESKKMIIILVSVVAVLGLFYFIAGIITGSIDLNKNEPAEIQYSEILAGSTFKQEDEEYVVLYYNFTKEDASEYTDLVSTYTSSDNSVSIYTVDLSRKFNSSYIRNDEEVANTNPKAAKELKIKDPTLIRIKDKQVIKYIENYEEIKNYMSESSN